MRPITLGDARLLKDLFRDGTSIYRSGFSNSGKKLLLELEGSGIIQIRRTGLKSLLIHPVSPIGFIAYIKTYHGIENFDNYIQALELENPDRSELSALGQNTKIRSIGPKTGIHLASPSPLEIDINSIPVNLFLPNGCALFVHENSHISIPEDVTIVGVENFTNLTAAARQLQLFEQYGRVMFAERSGTLQSTLKYVQNKYVHFGDIDLAGVHIYQTEYAPIVQERGSFFLPCSIEEVFESYPGVSALYSKQKNKYATLVGIDSLTQRVIDNIHNNKKGIEQESFIQLKH